MTWAGDRDVAAAAEALASRLPAELAVFAKLAYNYRWSWLPGGPQAFRDIDPYRWSMRRQNPVRLLLEAPAASLHRAARDARLVRRAEELHRAMQEDLDRPFSAGSDRRPVAFLCAEYGVHRSLPTYGGGLGVLAGDISKEASDMALPFVSIGLMYRQGNFHQRIDQSGWQQEYWIESDPDRLPAALVTGDDGQPLTITVPLRGREVVAQIWRVNVGRVPLYLLDTQRPENSRSDRWITGRLYVGDRKIRLAQYALLGIGGMRALRAMGIDPAVVHVNEGHGALAPLELAAEAVEAGETLEHALDQARRRTVFTTHTPVPAGNETYGAAEIREVLGDVAAQLHMDEHALLALGRSRPEDDGEPLGLTVLAIRMARDSNAVSEVHGEVARLMWHHLFPGRSVDDVPIRHITNGVHLPTWMSSPMRELLDRYLDAGWMQRADDPTLWKAVDHVPDEELWEVRNTLRRGLTEYVRDRTVGDRLARGEPVEYSEAGAAFDPDILTIGFARRVAAYKRLGLLAQDPDRAQRLLHGPRPIQVVLAGKAHPSDGEAKALLQTTFNAKWATDGDRVTFLEDYGMGMAGQLTAGCDVWVNLPRPPLEASGTSGMKSGLNGGLNLSILDGWWAEAYDGTNGWGIPSDPSLPPEEQDARDAQALYELLENEVTRLFTERDERGVPSGWVELMRSSLKTVGPRFCATRMVREYLETVYRLS